MNPGDIIVIDRDWSSYSKGTRFKFVQAVPCGKVQQADGSFINPTNLRVVLEAEPMPALDETNLRLCRTIPEEYAVVLPQVNDYVLVEANQGDRDGNVIAVSGSQYLVEYEMPAGRTFGRIFDVLKPNWHRAICLTNLPARWQKELAA